MLFIVGKDKFVIPMVCCRKCAVQVLYHEYLINMGSGKILVPYHSIIGEAYGLYNLSFDNSITWLYLFWSCAMVSEA